MYTYLYTYMYTYTYRRPNLILGPILFLGPGPGGTQADGTRAGWDQAGGTRAGPGPGEIRAGTRPGWDLARVGSGPGPVPGGSRAYAIFRCDPAISLTRQSLHCI